MLVRRDAGKIGRQKRVEIIMRTIAVLIFLVVIFSSENWRFLLFVTCFLTVMNMLPLDRNSPDTMVPYMELRDDLVIVNEDRIKIGDIDLSQSHMTEKKLRLYSKSAKWKNTIKANLTFLRKDDVEALRKTIWGKG